MAEPDLVRPSTWHPRPAGCQRGFLLRSPRRCRTSAGPGEPKPRSTLAQAAPFVSVYIKFHPSLDFAYERHYHSSPSFQPTDQTCYALVRRLSHCSTELLTRQDSTALIRNIPQIGDGKPLRFELIYHIYRDGPVPWVTKIFRSHQKHPVEKPYAIDIARSTDYIVGSFLKLHDSAFKWSRGMLPEPSSTGSEMLKPLSNPISLLHIPQPSFVDATQRWEFVPGYDVMISFRSRCRSRRQREWQRTITLESKQGSPLTLSHGEEMAWALSTAMQSALDARKVAFDSQYRACKRTDFPDEYRYSEQDAVHVGFQIRNRLGLHHRHLGRELDSSLLLFQDPDGLDCNQFVSHLEHSFRVVRDNTDKELGEMNDLILMVHGLSGRNWKTDKSFAVCLDSTICYSRRTVKAILERVQTGVADVLGSNDVSVTLMVHKRGHLVLDKTFRARSPYYATGQRQNEDLESVKEHFVTKLKDRIHADIVMVIKDTCSLSDCEPQNVRIVERPVPAAKDLAGMTNLPCRQPPSIPVTNDVASSVFGDSFTESSEPSALQSETPQNYARIRTRADHVGDNVGPSEQPETPTRASAFGGHLNSSARSSLSIAMTEDGETTYPSTSSSPPSLVHEDSGSPRDSLLVTPTFQRSFFEDGAIKHSLSEPPSPTMPRFNGQRRFSLVGKGSHTVSLQPPVSIDPVFEQRSLPNSDASSWPESGDGVIVVKAQEVASKSEVDPEPVPTRSLERPEATVAPATQEPALQGWLGYCCVPLDAEEQAAAPDSEPEPAISEAEVQGNTESVRQESANVNATIEARPKPDTTPPSLEGFLEYAVEPFVEEGEDSDAEFHDADSPLIMTAMSSPSSFATATENGSDSPINLEDATPSPFSLDSASPLRNDDKDVPSPSAPGTVDSDPIVEHATSDLGSAVKVDSCTSSTDTMEPATSVPHLPKATAPPVPEVTWPGGSTPRVSSIAPTLEATPPPADPEPPEPCSLEAEEPFLLLTDPLGPSPDLPTQPSSIPFALTLTETQSVSSEALRTPTSKVALQEQPSTRPLTENEDPEPTKPAVSWPELSGHDANTFEAHDDTETSLSHLSPRAILLLPNQTRDTYLSHMHKIPIPRPLLSRPDAGAPAPRSLIWRERQFSSQTAGLLGLREPRRIDLGLLRGVFHGKAALPRQTSLGPRPSQVLLGFWNKAERGGARSPDLGPVDGSPRRGVERGLGLLGRWGLITPIRSTG